VDELANVVEVFIGKRLIGLSCKPGFIFGDDGVIVGRTPGHI
jgi:hypothetical protein